ncbi:pyruvate phosphate dikinase [bacterium SM23_57]|jgi:pyruvate,water dikinase|nr:MAG: pyruvate phosphate dikinase [bacterium SM23_57]
MTEDLGEPLDQLVHELKERAKELNCLYEVQALLNNPEISLDEVLNGIIKAIPPGWQYPEICQAKIRHDGVVYHSDKFIETPWVQQADIVVQDNIMGEISVYYTEERPLIDEGPFMREERRLINTIADQLGNYLLGRQLKDLFERGPTAEETRETGWRVVLNLLRRTDPNLLVKISQKMINYLCWIGVKEAESLLEYLSPAYRTEMDVQERNAPFQITTQSDILAISDHVFELAGKHLSDEDIFEHIQQWIRDDQSSFLIDTLVAPGSSLTEISSAIERYYHLTEHGLRLSEHREKSARTALIRRLLSDHTSYILTANRYTEVKDFSDLLRKMIFPTGSHGKLGGKGAGLFLATHILRKAPEENEFLGQIRVPKTRYISSDSIFSFMGYNDLDGVVERKYLNISQVRQEYPYVVHIFKNSPFTPEIVKELSLILDEFNEVPLIVRSSSLLEDQAGMSFAGKYKSLFIPNQGSKEKRLNNLQDAIAEVYASMFGPDPIEYRLEHGLIDHHEEMGILIQEVVGTKVGPYFFPAYAGVAFSNNEFRWSSRIKREDGLVRIVPGLGTRAVDRMSDDFPILAAPGQPGLRVNVSNDEIVRYSPKMMDVINMETESFETVDIQSLLKTFGHKYPNIRQLISLVSHDTIHQPLSAMIDFENENFVFTFDGLFSRTPFLKQIHNLLKTLQMHFNHPVDIEFASDGKDFYLLQCRSQSYTEDIKPAEIPREINPDNVIFTAKRHISNGAVTDVTHIVYVDPYEYSRMSDRQALLSVGRAVSRLNKLLPKRQFILMGPGRWGSRGDIKLGVSVTYSDISNTAALIEIAIKSGDLLPELSFGTHFFQDLIETSIRYLPLYPDDYGTIFNYEFILTSNNILPDLLPDLEHLSDVIRVIDVPRTTGGQVLQLLMNADISEAVAMLSHPSEATSVDDKPSTQIDIKPREEHWRWRMQSVETVAMHLEPERFGVAGLYIFGSTKNATAGPKSDIDLLIHFQGDEHQRRDLLAWLQGWSLSLSHANYLRTGYKTDGLLDIQLVTDEDIQKRTSYAVKIGAINDPARPIPLGRAGKDS